jgi:hypothetical protein
MEICVGQCVFTYHCTLVVLSALSVWIGHETLAFSSCMLMFSLAWMCRVLIIIVMMVRAYALDRVYGK